MKFPEIHEVQLLPTTGMTQVNAHVRAAIQRQVFPAAAVMVIHRGETRLLASWGWLDPTSQRHATTPGTRFDLASITKLFTTTALLQLISEGKAALQTPLVAIIPVFGAVSPRPIDGGQHPITKQTLPTPLEHRGQAVDPTTVTLWHLLTHTSGLPAWRSIHEVNPFPHAIAHTHHAQHWQRGLDALCGYAFVGQPGAAVLYSDIGLMLLGEVVSRLHGTPGNLEAAVQARINARSPQVNAMFNPLLHGIPREQIVPTEHDSLWRKRRMWGEVHDENTYSLGGIAGHAGLFADVVSLGAFGQRWLDGAWGIAPELAARATHEQAVTGDQRRGLGWMLKAGDASPAGERFSTDSYGHTGFTGTSLWIDPHKRLVVAALTNRVYYGREPTGILHFRRGLHDILHTTLSGA
jgi:serine-type D-Ala-D-Ala carboxypeptidase